MGPASQRGVAPRLLGASADRQQGALTGPRCPPGGRRRALGPVRGAHGDAPRASRQPLLGTPAWDRPSPFHGLRKRGSCCFVAHFAESRGGSSPCGFEPLATGQSHVAHAHTGASWEPGSRSSPGEKHLQAPRVGPRGKAAGSGSEVGPAAVQGAAKRHRSRPLSRRDKPPPALWALMGFYCASPLRAGPVWGRLAALRVRDLGPAGRCLQPQPGHRAVFPRGQFWLVAPGRPSGGAELGEGAGARRGGGAPRSSSSFPCGPAGWGVGGGALPVF